MAQPTSSSSKSKSISRPYSRPRALSRKPSFRDWEEGDIRYVWASYSLGGFEGAFEADLSGLEFEEAFLDRVGEGVGAFTLFAPNKDDAPVGLMLVAGFDGNLWPHVIWFPWASPRNKIEVVLRFLNDMRRDAKLVVAAETKDRDFFVTMCRYGVMRRIGTS